MKIKQISATILEPEAFDHSTQFYINILSQCTGEVGCKAETHYSKGLKWIQREAMRNSNFVIIWRISSNLRILHSMSAKSRNVFNSAHSTVNVYNL